MFAIIRSVPTYIEMRRKIVIVVARKTVKRVEKVN